jgi:LPXTG-site transpeptidase (sortase) family protein
MLVVTLARHSERLPMRLVSRFALGAALIAAALLLVACGDDAKTDDSRTGSVTGPETATATSAAGTPTTPPESPAAQANGMATPKEGTVLERLVIPSIQLEAPVETRGLNSRGEMEDPGGRDAVAWYNFSEFPGFGGNAVFSGHVDWFTGELGAFGRMKDLKEGDDVIVRMSDGMEIKYKVTESKLYEANKVDVEEVVGRTQKDSLTFITCEGTFNRSAQDYSHRRVVRAERVA